MSLSTEEVQRISVPFIRGMAAYGFNEVNIAANCGVSVEFVHRVLAGRDEEGTR